MKKITSWVRGIVGSVVAGVLCSAMGVYAAQWDGDDSQGNLTWWNNYYGNNPGAWNSSTDLEFNFNNTSQTTLTHDWGSWLSVRSIVYNSTFSQNTTLGTSGNGFDLYWKIENYDTGSHTINAPISVLGASFEINPISGNLTIGGTIFNSNNRDLNVYGNGGNTLTLNSTLSGSGGLTVHQNSTVVLSGNQTYTGDTTINAGSVQLGAANRIADSSDLIVGSSGTFNMNNNNETVASLSLASGGQVQMGTGQLIVNGGSGTWAGGLTASSGGSLVKKSAGVISITGNNSGLAAGSALYVVGGTLGLNNNGAAGSATVYLGEESGSDAATLDISSAGVSVGNAIIVRSGSSGIKTLDNASGGTITFGGSITLNTVANIDASTGESTIMNGSISGVGGLVRRGFGNVTLNAANSYSGGTYIDEGTLTIGNGGDIQSSSGIDIGSSIYNAGAGNAALALSAGAADLDRNITVQSGAGSRTLSSADDVTLSGNIDLNRNLTVSSSAGTLTIQGAVDLANSGNNDLLTSGNIAISGGITASSGASSIDHSSGTLTLSGNNSGSSYMLNIAGGTVALNNVNALGTAYFDKVNFTGSGTLDVNANISAAGLGIRVGNGQTATIDVNGGNTFTVAGALASISGSGTFIQTGAGTVNLTGVSTYSGTYNLNQGTLMGNGTIRTFVQNSGVLSPGSSPGTLTVDGAATWNGGSYLWEINDLAGTQGGNPGWDFVDISGALNITAAYNINMTWACWLVGTP